MKGLLKQENKQPPYNVFVNGWLKIALTITVMKKIFLHLTYYWLWNSKATLKQGWQQSFKKKIYFYCSTFSTVSSLSVTLKLAAFPSCNTGAVVSEHRAVLLWVGACYAHYLEGRVRQVASDYQHLIGVTLITWHRFALRLWLALCCWREPELFMLVQTKKFYKQGNVMCQNDKPIPGYTWNINVHIAGQ